MQAKMLGVVAYLFNVWYLVTGRINVRIARAPPGATWWRGGGVNHGAAWRSALAALIYKLQEGVYEIVIAFARRRLALAFSVLSTRRWRLVRG